jgi:methanogenic corrinoid protein MtbC1
MDKQYSIQEASQLTGLSDVLLRAWESRYKAVIPGRNAGNQRRYSLDQIERLRLLARAVERGHRISLLADLDTPELESLLHDSEDSPGGLLGESLDDAYSAIRAIRPGELGRIFQDVADALGPVRMLESFALPLLYELGAGWRDGTWKIQHEHLATEVLKIFILNQASHNPSPPDAPALLSATAPGQRHEIGAMAVAMTASIAGFQSYYLGPDLPVAELIDLANSLHLRVLAVSTVFPESLSQTRRDIEALERGLPDSCRLLLGGQSAGLLNISGIELAPSDLLGFLRWLSNLLESEGNA